MFVLTIEKMSLKPSKQIKYQNNTIFSLNIRIFNFLLLWYFLHIIVSKNEKRKETSQVSRTSDIYGATICLKLIKMNIKMIYV